MMQGGDMGGMMQGGMGCGTMGGGMGKGAGGKTGGGGGGAHPGDWRCRTCGDHVFASRPSCRKCGTTKEGAVGGGQAEMTGGSGGCGGCGMMGGRGGCGGAMQGDWNCPNCGDLVFARNMNCRKCGAAKDGSAGDSRSSRAAGSSNAQRREGAVAAGAGRGAEGGSCKGAGV